MAPSVNDDAYYCPLWYSTHETETQVNTPTPNLFYFNVRLLQVNAPAPYVLFQYASLLTYIRPQTDFNTSCSGTGNVLQGNLTN